MKKIITILLIVVFAITALCIWQRNNLKALYMFLTNDKENVEKIIEENSKELENKIKEYAEYIPRGFTPEEEAMIASGELSVEEATALLLGEMEFSTGEEDVVVEATPDDEFMQEDAESGESAEELKPGKDTTSKPATETAKPGKDATSKPATETAKPGKDTTSKPATETAKPGKDATSKPATEELKPGKDTTSKPATETAKPGKDTTSKPAAETAKPGKDTTSKPATEELKPGKDATSKPATETAKPGKDTTSKPAAETAKPGKDTASKPEAEPSKTGNASDIIKKYTAQFYSLKAYYSGQLGQLESQARSEYSSLTKEQKKSTSKAAFVAKYAGRASALESECDGKVNGILSGMKAELKAIGADTAVIDTIKSAYASEKAARKAQYMNMIN